jgi:hypothetical protein
MAGWLEDAQPDVITYSQGTPHNADPAYDILTVIEVGGNEYAVRFIQVKATESNAQSRCSEAVRKFKALESGEYEPQIAAALDLLERREPLCSLMEPGELFDVVYRSDHRYRVTVIHGEPVTGIQLLTRFHRAIPGPVDRRSGQMVQVEWEHFWQKLGRRVYAQLS